MLETRYSRRDLLPVALTTPYLSSAYPCYLVSLTLRKLWIVNFTSKWIPLLFFSWKHLRSALWWAETLSGPPRSHCLGTRLAHTGPAAVDSCRAQKVVAVLISLLGNSNQCKSSFVLSFFFKQGLEISAVFCLLKPVKYCILLRVNRESWTDEWVISQGGGGWW